MTGIILVLPGNCNAPCGIYAHALIVPSDDSFNNNIHVRIKCKMKAEKKLTEGGCG